MPSGGAGERTVCPETRMLPPDEALPQPELRLPCLRSSVRGRGMTVFLRHLRNA
jgi:hypothetical protein